MAGAWLLTGTANLRNQPKAVDFVDGVVTYAKPWAALHRWAGYFYVVSSFLKGSTASLMSIYSHSLGASRIPMVLYGMWDVFSLYKALAYILRGNVALHKKWMIRNFCMGAGSIWVRVVGAIWAACDLSFMEHPDRFRKMNDVALL